MWLLAGPFCKTLIFFSYPWRWCLALYYSLAPLISHAGLLHCWNITSFAYIAFAKHLPSTMFEWISIIVNFFLCFSINSLHACGPKNPNIYKLRRWNKGSLTLNIGAIKFYHHPCLAIVKTKNSVSNMLYWHIQPRLLVHAGQENGPKVLCRFSILIGLNLECLRKFFEVRIFQKCKYCTSEITICHLSYPLQNSGHNVLFL